ncbi:hypothetical protein D9M68_405650 [compost metagenome]
MAWIFSSQVVAMIEARSFPVSGKPQCLLADHVQCPTHKGKFPLVSGGDGSAIVIGRPLVFEPAQLACGSQRGTR